MVTVGFKDNGRPLCKILSYHKTYNDAYIALVEYHRNPRDLNADMTMEELYNIWYDHHYTGDTPLSTLNGIKAAWSHCKSITQLRVTEFKVRNIKQLYELLEVSANTRSRIKQLLSMMLDYAMECEIVDKNPARNFSLSAEDEKKISMTENPHEAFTDDELDKIRRDESQTAEILYFMCYSGWRPREVLSLKLKNINEGYMIGGMKTDAGTDRIVPIHPKISMIAKKNWGLSESRGSQYLFSMNDGKQIPYINLYKNTKSLMKKLGLDQNHRPHDARKTFVTKAKEASVNEFAIKRIIGHAISDLTERVYTERPIEWLKEEIEKIM
jgi:integrase